MTTERKVNSDYPTYIYHNGGCRIYRVTASGKTFKSFYYVTYRYWNKLSVGDLPF